MGRTARDRFILSQRSLRCGAVGAGVYHPGPTSVEVPGNGCRWNDSRVSAAAVAAYKKQEYLFVICKHRVFELRSRVQ